MIRVILGFEAWLANSGRLVLLNSVGLLIFGAIVTTVEATGEPGTGQNCNVSSDVSCVAPCYEFDGPWHGCCNTYGEGCCDRLCRTEECRNPYPEPNPCYSPPTVVFSVGLYHETACHNGNYCMPEDP
jgi:hypothetical protein